MNQNQCWGLLPTPAQQRSQMFPSASARAQQQNLPYGPTGYQAQRPTMNPQRVAPVAPPSNSQYYNPSQPLPAQINSYGKSQRPSLLDTLRGGGTDASQVSSTLDNILKSIGIDTNLASKKKLDVPKSVAPSQFGIIENQMNSYMNQPTQSTAPSRSIYSSVPRHSLLNQPPTRPYPGAAQAGPPPQCYAPGLHMTRAAFPPSAPIQQSNSYSREYESRPVARPFVEPQEPYSMADRSIPLTREPYPSHRSNTTTFPLVSYGSPPPSQNRNRSRSPFAGASPKKPLRYGDDAFDHAFSAHRHSARRRSVSPGRGSPKRRRDWSDEETERRSLSRKRIRGGRDFSPLQERERSPDKQQMISKLAQALERERSNARHMEEKLRRELRTLESEADRARYQLSTIKKVEREREMREEKEREKEDVFYTYRDSGKYWCSECRHISSTLVRALQHNLSDEHFNKVKDKPAQWFTDTSRPSRHTEVIDGGSIKGVEFLRPIRSAYFCEVCNTFAGDESHAKQHVRSRSHNVNYQKHTSKIPGYERQIIKDMDYELYQRNKNEEENLVPEENSLKPRNIDAKGEETTEPIVIFKGTRSDSSKDVKYEEGAKVVTKNESDVASHSSKVSDKVQSLLLSPNQSISSESEAGECTGSSENVKKSTIKPATLNIMPEPQPIVPLGLPRRLLKTRTIVEPMARSAQSTPSFQLTKVSSIHSSSETTPEEKDSNQIKEGTKWVTCTKETKEQSITEKADQILTDVNPDDIGDFELVDECI